jgi:hypothetical protein
VGGGVGGWVIEMCWNGRLEGRLGMTSWGSVGLCQFRWDGRIPVCAVK